MNIIGVMGPKLVTLLTILIPSIVIRNKIILLVIWLIAFIIDYDAARPGHNGRIYKLTNCATFEVGELIVALIQFIPHIAFLLATILMRSWIPFIPGIIAVLAYFLFIIECIKDIIKRKKA